jgi:hypothetical protein
MKGSVIWLQRAALGMLLAVLMLAALTARMIVEGEAELRTSDAAFDRGDLADATLHARRAATLFAPGAPHVTAAFERMRAIAMGAESQGDVNMALRAWGSIRGAALETRHFVVPHAAELTLANANLARLTASSPGGERQKATHLLSRDETPRAPWVVVLGLGFSLFASGLVLAARKGIAPTGEISRKALALAGLLALFGVAFWTLAVYRA